MPYSDKSCWLFFNYSFLFLSLCSFNNHYFTIVLSFNSYFVIYLSIYLCLSIHPSIHPSKLNRQPNILVIWIWSACSLVFLLTLVYSTTIYQLANLSLCLPINKYIIHINRLIFVILILSPNILIIIIIPITQLL